MSNPLSMNDYVTFVRSFVDDYVNNLHSDQMREIMPQWTLRTYEIAWTECSIVKCKVDEDTFTK